MNAQSNILNVKTAVHRFSHSDKVVIQWIQEVGVPSTKDLKHF